MGAASRVCKEGPKTGCTMWSNGGGLALTITQEAGMAKRLEKFGVEGDGKFPIDMLRYDSCWPHSSIDVDAFNRKGRRTITLASYSAPTIARWESFGWRCHY